MTLGILGDALAYSTARTLSGTVTITSTNLSPQVQITIDITFNIAGSGTGGGGNLTLNNTGLNSITIPLTYDETVGTVSQTPVTLQSASGATSYSYTITTSDGGSWLAFNGSSSPGSGQLSACSSACYVGLSSAVAALSPGTYQGIVNLTAPDGATATINVSLTVNGGTASGATVTPGSYQFTAPSGGTNILQAIFRVTAASGVTLGITTSNDGARVWLTAVQTGIGSSITVVAFANPSGLVDGTYSGSIVVTSTAPGGSKASTTIPITLVVGSPLAMGTLNPFTAAVGGAAPASQALSVSAATATSFTVNASTTSGGNWLTLTSASGVNLTNGGTLTTNQNITVTANPSGLTSGTYSGTISVTARGITQPLKVTLVVTPASGNVTATPTSLSFTYQIGGKTPDMQGTNIACAVQGAAPISFTVSVDSQSATWLSTSFHAPMATPSTLNVYVNPSGPSAGTYTGTITITPNGGTPVQVHVTLTVQPPPTVSASPGTLAFTYQTGDQTPAATPLQVTGNGSSLAFTAQATSADGWLAVSPSGGTTPATLSVTISPGNLPAGTYTGTILVSGTGTATGSTGITVSLTVRVPLPAISSVVNAASFIKGSVSPGEIVTIFGTSLGPATAAYATVDPSTGRLATTIGGVQVLFNGIAAPLIYANNTQVSAIAPYEMAAIASPLVWIKYMGQTSNTYLLTLTTTAPGLFTQNSRGNGPGAILNQDGSVNGPNNGAAPGSIVVVYLTGEGQTSPAGVTGAFTAATLPPPQVTPAPLHLVGVQIDGQPANFTYAGEAPGFAAGLMQLNVQIPPGARTGDLPVYVTVGGSSTQNDVTVSVSATSPLNSQ